MDRTIECAAADKPYRQSKSGMSDNRWKALLTRWLAGEPLRELRAEFRVSPSAVHWNANKFGMKKRGHPGAVRSPKGPTPITVETAGEEAPPRLVCAELAFVFDRTDPEATLQSIYDQVARAAEAGDARKVGMLNRIAGQVSVMVARDQRVRSLTGRMEADAEPFDDLPGAPHVLRPAQIPPAGDWRTWLFLGGRGAGKTLAGAEWLADQADRLGSGGRLALIGPTLHDVREVMIEGVSGMRSLPRWTRRTRPVYQPSRRRLYFENGCVACAFSAEDPDSLRGPQFSAAWADELCAWPSQGARGAAETLAMLRMGLRLPLAGAAPRLVVTTTPRPTRALVRLRDEASCVATHAPTTDNAENLAPGFLDDLRALYGGTRREAQELEGKIVDLDGALFTAEMMMRARVVGEGTPSTMLRMVPLPQGGGYRSRHSSPIGGGGPPKAVEGGDATPFERAIVAIDPPATASGDACGIIAAASRLRPDGVREAVILADRSAHGLSPEEWARRAVALAREVGATRLVAEVNQGGDMVASVLKAVDGDLPLRQVRATKGKRLRAEPVAALYEQGRIRHAAPFDALEEELMALGSDVGEGSLDRADALVWAVTDLLIDRPGEWGPRCRVA